MNLLFYISTLAVIATSCFILGFNILFKNRKSRANRLFFISSMLLNSVIIFTIMIQLSDNAETVKFIQSVYNIVLISFLLGMLYFSLVFTGFRLNIFFKSILAVLSLSIFIIFLLHGRHLLYVAKINGLWIYKFINYPFWFLFYSPLLCFIMFLMLFSLHRFSKNASSSKEKSQAMIMIVSIITAFVSGFICLMIFPLFKIYMQPLLTPYFLAVFMYGVFFAMIKYRFMTFGINDIAIGVLSYIPEMIIILGTDRIIMDVNTNVVSTLPAGADTLRGKNINDVIEPDNYLESSLDSLISGKADCIKCRLTYKSEPERIITDSAISKVYDRFGDFSAILIVSTENKGIAQFRRYFGLTEREMEIIILTISGMTNIAIAEKLGITKRTVETHQNNIYNKLGIGNKIELLKVAGEFSIQPA